MGVDLFERQARCSADHPPAVRQLSQVVLPIKGTSYSAKSFGPLKGEVEGFGIGIERVTAEELMHSAIKYVVFQ